MDQPAYMNFQATTDDTNNELPSYASFTKQQSSDDDLPQHSNRSRDITISPSAKFAPIIPENLTTSIPDNTTDNELQIISPKSLNDEECQHASWYKNWVVDLDECEEEEETEDENPEHKKKKKKSKSRFGDVSRLVSTYCQDWEDSPLDIATFFFCLSAFNKSVHETKDVIFDEALILDAYHYGQFAFASYKGSKKQVLKRLKFLDESDYIAGDWDKLILSEAPAWFCALDHDKKNVILSLRGTKEKDDIFVDLAAQFVKWDNGYVHQGFLRSLKKLEPYVLPVVTEQMQKNPGYCLRIVGHSMGAAVSSLLTIKWHKEYPEWNIHGYGYATPCCVSANLSRDSEDYFTTFVHHHDAVSRLSMGSIQDLHNGMRMFVARVKEQYKQLVFLRSLNFALQSDNKKILAIVGEVNEIIQKNLEKELKGENPAHLLPAGKTYQLWREKRGNKFTTWQMYRSTCTDYARLTFSPTMLKDHGSQGYNSAFENMLSISVTERKIWLKMTPTKREVVRAYWNDYPQGDPFSPDFNMTPAKENMSRNSKYKTKAMVQGLIRPFLYLVSMSPKRRAALAELMGIHLVNTGWYNNRDSHREAWHVLASGRKGLQSRSNSTRRKVVPLSNGSNWYMILYSCAHRVKTVQHDYIPVEIRNLLKGKEKGYSTTIAACQNPRNPTLGQLEEIVLLIFFSLTDADVIATKDKKKKQKKEIPEIEAPEDMKPTIDYTKSPVYQQTRVSLKSMGFTVEPFIHKVSVQRVQDSSSKKANEVYSWGDVIRKEDERLKKRQVAGIGALGILSGALFLSAVPMVAVAPPLALVPLGLAVGVGGAAATKATPGGLVSIVAGCLQQRLVLAAHKIMIDDYYPGITRR